MFYYHRFVSTSIKMCNCCVRAPYDTLYTCWECAREDHVSAFTRKLMMLMPTTLLIYWRNRFSIQQKPKGNHVSNKTIT